MGLIKKGLLIEKGVLILQESAQSAPRTQALPAVEEGLKEPEVMPEQVSEQMIETHAGATNEELEGFAKTEAEEIIRKAMDEAQAIKEQARESGIEEAKAAAEEGASEKVKEAVATLNQAVMERKRIIKDAENEILRLALKVSEQIIKSEVSLHRDVSLNIVTDAISRVSDREQVIVRVNREDIETIKQYKDRIGSVVDGIKSLSIVEDSAVEPGGCVIETNLGYVDARISTKIAAIEEAFKKVR